MNRIQFHIVRVSANALWIWVHGVKLGYGTDIGCTPQKTLSRRASDSVRFVGGNLPSHIPIFQQMSVESKQETYILSINAPGYISVQSFQFQPCHVPKKIKIKNCTHAHSYFQRQLVPKLQFSAVARGGCASHDSRQIRQTIVPALMFTQLLSSVAPSCNSSHLVVRKVSFSTSISELFLFSPFMVLRSSG